MLYAYDFWVVLWFVYSMNWKERHMPRRRRRLKARRRRRQRARSRAQRRKRRKAQPHRHHRRPPLRSADAMMTIVARIAIAIPTRIRILTLIPIHRLDKLNE